MGKPSSTSVFISYARRDGAELAQRLQRDLAARGIDAWLDTRRLEPGSTWSVEIERAINACEAILVLMTSGSYASEICRGEQLRAGRRGKRLIPILAQAGADRPVYLEPKQYLDFTSASAYQQRFEELVTTIERRGGVPLDEKYRTTYVTAPPLPRNYVERPEALANLRNALITDGSGPSIALTALEGMGGIGKTILAQVLAHDEVVQQAFPDGVIWTTVGKEPRFDLVTRMQKVRRALGDEPLEKESDLECINRYRSVMQAKAALVVVDDVWRPADVEPFRADPPRSRLLFTTRDASIAAAVGAEEHTAELLTAEQSRALLARWAHANPDALPPEAENILRDCGRLPLALAMIGAMLRGKPSAYWKFVGNLLRCADLAKIKAQFPDYPHTDLLRAIQVSVDALDAKARERYLALAVMLEDMPIAPAIQQTLWGADEMDALETAEQFVSLSVAQREAQQDGTQQDDTQQDGDADSIRLPQSVMPAQAGIQPSGNSGSIRLHDLQLDYVRAQYPDRQALDLIHGAMHLSSHVIERDPSQFASQMVGRLLPHQELPTVRQFTESLIKGAPRPWLRPLTADLIPPGGPLLRTLAGHSSGVSGVTVAPDGKQAVSGSHDHTLKVWDLASGREFRTLTGHGGDVSGVAVTPDGKQVVSGSHDYTLKVWDLGNGRKLHTLAGHWGGADAVAVTPDGKQAVSAGWDGTLKVWDLASGPKLLTLTGHGGYVLAVAVTPDGKQVVSASLDHTLRVWDLASGRQLRVLTGHGGGVRAVALTPDGQRAVSASNDQTLKVWDLASGRELRTLTGHSSSVNAVAVAPNGKQAISASGDCTLKVWELASGRALRTLTGHSSDVNAVAVTPDGKQAVSASADRTVRLWDLTNVGELRILTGHGSEVTAIAVTPDGKEAVSASWDHTLKVWDLASGRELRILASHNSHVNAVAVTPDGKQVVSASWDHTLKVWDLASETGTPHPHQPQQPEPGRCGCGDAGWEAGGLRLRGPYAQGVGPRQRSGTPHPCRPQQGGQGGGGDAGWEAGGLCLG